MKILPIQYKYSCDNNNSNIQYKTQSPQKTFHNATTPQSVTFTGLADFFKFEKVFLNEKQTLALLNNAGIKVVNTIKKLMGVAEKNPVLD